MTEAELNQWLHESPHVIAYMAALLSGILVSSFLVIKKRIHHLRIGAPTIPEWKIQNVDFGLFLLALFMWAMLASEVFRQIHGWLFPDQSIGTGAIILSGLIFQSGMLYLFFRFRHHFRTANERPLSTQLLGTWDSFKLGLTHFLAALPVIYSVGFLWSGFLQLLRDAGIEFELPVQESVRMFQSSDNILYMAGLIFLAVVVAPIVEEHVFRGGVYRFTKGRFPKAMAMLLSSMLFGMVHWNLQSFPGLVAVGVCLCLTYEWTGSIRVPIFFHACFNLNSVIWILLLPEKML